MKNLKKVLALVLAVVMIMGTVAVASAKDYSDVKTDNDYAVAIDVLSNLEILNGFPDETFRPDGLLTRAEAAKIVAIIHNAATNGKIDADIADLYKNAQNSFVDCNNSWALPYINYCRITGLADGMTTTTYEPNRKLTGVQFLKLMLTTLNFDSAKEGYTGKGWDINVLNRANEVGLTKGLSKDWRGINELKRGEAAQIIYNALTKYLVEYGQLVKNNVVNTAIGSGKLYYSSSFISNEQVARSGYTLAKKMGVSVTRTTDAYRRPGYTWSYGSWTGFYMDTPVNTYTTAVSMCDILKNDMGVAENKDTVVKLNGVSAETETTTAALLTVKGKSVANTALNYFAVDGYKYTTMQLMHDIAKNCQKTSGFTNWKYKAFGGQGDLTQVFETEDGWVITTIHTFLGEVTKVNANNKYSHAIGETSEIKFWTEMVNDKPYYVTARGIDKKVSGAKYAVGDKILVQVSLKDTEAANKGDMLNDDDTVYYDDNGNVYRENDSYALGAVTIIGTADSKTGKLTGASDFNYVETVSIDGTKYNTNCRFALGKNDAMNIANNGKTYTFYFDTYGNVIGRVNEVVTTAAEYVIVDRIYGVHDAGKFVIKADMHDTNGTLIEAATIKTAGAFADAFDGWDNWYDPTANSEWDGVIYTLSAKNHADLVNALYSYKVDDKGAYTLNFAGEATTGTIGSRTGYVYQYSEAYGKVEANIAHTAKLAYLTITEGTKAINYAGKTITPAYTGAAHDYELPVSESTKFVVKNTAGEYKTYTGYTELPALTASALDFVDTDNDDFADIVFLVGAVYAADNVTGWVLKWTPFNWAGKYDIITVYVDGEPVNVNVLHSLLETGEDSNGDTLVRGLYKFVTKVDEDGVTYCDVIKAEENLSMFSGIAAAACSKDSTSLKLTIIDNGVEYYETIGLTNVVIYNVKADGTVVKADASCIAEGDMIVYSKVTDKGNAPYAVIYVIDQF